jgi:Beta-glucan synthesis-associated protein SKN1/KRE6/Sbg1
MILYRRVDIPDTLLPPAFPTRDSVISTSGETFVSLSADSKYPAGMLATERGLVAYAYDPFVDDQDPSDDDQLHDPEGKGFKTSGQGVSWRGLRNLTMLLLLLAGLLSLFIVYPVFSFLHNNGVNLLIVENARINSTGQAELVNLNTRSQITIL